MPRIFSHINLVLASYHIVAESAVYICKETYINSEFASAIYNIFSSKQQKFVFQQSWLSKFVLKMAFSLARNLGLLRQQGCSSDLLSFAAAISRGNFGQNRCSSTAPVPQESNKNLYGAERAGKYSPFEVRWRYRIIEGITFWI